MRQFLPALINFPCTPY